LKTASHYDLIIIVVNQPKEHFYMTGVVKFFNDAKGYGFIVSDETKKDIFVHFTGIEGSGHRSLKEGQKVTFDVVNDEKSGKERAVHVN